MLSSPEPCEGDQLFSRTVRIVSRQSTWSAVWLVWTLRRTERQQSAVSQILHGMSCPGSYVLAFSAVVTASLRYYSTVISLFDSTTVGVVGIVRSEALCGTVRHCAVLQCAVQMARVDCMSGTAGQSAVKNGRTT